MFYFHHFAENADVLKRMTLWEQDMLNASDLVLCITTVALKHGFV